MREEFIKQVMFLMTDPTGDGAGPSILAVEVSDVDPVTGEVKSYKILPLAVSEQWFRMVHPGGHIERNIIECQPGRYALVRAVVYRSDGTFLADGFGECDMSEVEKTSNIVRIAATRATRDALTRAGFGCPWTENLQLEDDGKEKDDAKAENEQESEAPLKKESAEELKPNRRGRKKKAVTVDEIPVKETDPVNEELPDGIPVTGVPEEDPLKLDAEIESPLPEQADSEEIFAVTAVVEDPKTEEVKDDAASDLYSQLPEKMTDKEVSKWMQKLTYDDVKSVVCTEGRSTRGRTIEQIVSDGELQRLKFFTTMARLRGTPFYVACLKAIEEAEK